MINSLYFNDLFFILFLFHILVFLLFYTVFIKFYNSLYHNNLQSIEFIKDFQGLTSNFAVLLIVGDFFEVKCNFYQERLFGGFLDYHQGKISAISKYIFPDFNFFYFFKIFNLKIFLKNILTNINIYIIIYIILYYLSIISFFLSLKSMQEVSWVKKIPL